MAVTVGRSWRVVINGVDISELVREVQIRSHVGEFSVTHLELYATPDIVTEYGTTTVVFSTSRPAPVERRRTRGIHLRNRD